jgi:uncharacterized membrane protein
MITILKVIIYMLAATFAVVGMMKLKLDKKNLSRRLPWVLEFKPATIKFLGFIEIFGAICLAGPGLIGTAYQIIPYAAVGLCVLMILAGLYHSRKKEYTSLFINAILFALLAYVAFNPIQ